MMANASAKCDGHGVSELMNAKGCVICLTKRVKDLKAVLLNFAEHAIDNEGDDWICSLCGVKAPLETDLKKFPHEDWCPMHPEEA